METLPASPEDDAVPQNASETDIVYDSPVQTTTRDLGKPEHAQEAAIRLSLPPYPTCPPTRNYPPLSRPHIRSQSLACVSEGLPPMTRAHSSPGLDSRSQSSVFAKDDDISRNAVRHYSPPRLSRSEGLDTRTALLGILGTTSKHAESESMPSTSSRLEPHITLPTLLSQYPPRAGRIRPSSPLQFTSAPTLTANHSTGSPPPLVYSHSATISRYNESYPGLSTSSVSSVPSTPTSIRSRSPSISSLETIPDIPDAEAAAIEADRTATLKAVVDQVDEAEVTDNGARRRGAPDTLTVPRAGSSGYNRVDKRKRWSVCGAERRQDLDLETIWED